MNQLIVYCGFWKNIPNEIKQSVSVVSQVYETSKMMSQKGKDCVYSIQDLGGYDRRIFCNNDNAFLGMRVAVKEIGRSAAENLSFIFYDDKGIAHRIKLDSDGNFIEGYPDGFFEQSFIDMMELF